MKTIEDHVKLLAREAKMAFEEADLLDEAIVQRQLHSSIFNIRGNEALFQHLNQNNIICSRRGEGIRISFHYFNTLNDLDKLQDVLKKYSGRKTL